MLPMLSPMTAPTGTRSSCLHHQGKSAISRHGARKGGGTLGGSGLIRGPVVVQAGAAVSPGAILGTTAILTISNSLSLAGTTFMALNAAAGTNDLIRGLTTVSYGGTCR